MHALGYGVPGASWTPLVGDWDGDGADGVGLYDPASSTFYLTNTMATGFAEHTFGYGVPGGGWRPLVGDWDGNGSSGVGLYDPAGSMFYLTNSLSTGVAEMTIGFGSPGGGWEPIAGCWTLEPETLAPALSLEGRGSVLDAAAVDEIDLAAMVALELSRASEIESLTPVLPA